MYAYGVGSWGVAGGIGMKVDVLLRRIGGVGGGVAESVGIGAARGNISDGHITLMTGAGMNVIEWVWGFICCIQRVCNVVATSDKRIPMATFDKLNRVHGF